MKKIRKGIAMFLAAALLTGLAACNTANNSSAVSTVSSEIKKYTVGVVQYMTYPTLDASLKGFKEGLAAAGFQEGKNISYTVQNAQGDTSACTTAVSTAVDKKPDMIFAIATPAAQAVAKTVTDIPVVVTAVADPADAKLVDSNDKPGGNLTGTSDKAPVDEQVKLIKQVVPDASTVGILYGADDGSSGLQADWAKAACQSNGLQYQVFPVSTADEIAQTVATMAEKVQAIYIPNDTLLAANMKIAADAAVQAKLPIFTGESGMVQNGGLLTVGIDYEELGKQTGAMAAKILKGEEKPAETPIAYQKNYTSIYNSATAKQLELTLPESVVKGGKDVGSAS